MGIIIYQIGIFIVIQIAAMYSKKSRNTAIILILLFTILQVYTFGLMAFQFLTVWVSYYFANKWFSSQKEDDLICVTDEKGGRARMYKSDYEKMENGKSNLLQDTDLNKRNEYYDKMKE